MTALRLEIGGTGEREKRDAEIPAPPYPSPPLADFGLSVAECLALAPLTQADVVAGHSGLQRRARWVHVVDHEDIEDSLTGSELLLSSGVSLGHNPVLQKTIFTVMERRASAALILSIGPYLDRVPDAMRRDADRIGIPVIAIPWEVNFRDVTQVLLTRIVTQQYRLLEDVEEVNRSLLTVVIERGDLTILCTRFADVTGQDVAVLDTQFRSMGASSRDAALRLALPRAQRCALPRSGVSTATTAEGERLLLAPVVIAGRLSGWVVTSSGQDEPRRSEAMLLEAASLAAALIISQRDEILRTQAAHEQDALLGLIEGRQDAAAVAALGIVPGATYSILVVELERDRTPIDRHLIRRAIEPFSPRAKLFERTDQVVIVAPHGRKPSYQTLTEGLAEAMAAAEIAFRAGVSDPFETPGQARQAYLDAREALEVGRWLDPGKPCTLARDIAALSHFVRMIEAGPPVRFQRIRKLMEHDQAHRGELVRTLECFLSANQNAVLAARKLSVHRHTLAYRMDRIGDILGCELSAEVCLDLRLELIAHRMGRIGLR